MCFIKKTTPVSIEQVQAPQNAERPKADASQTKHSQAVSTGIKENIKTAPLGEMQNITSEKKTLLGE